MMSRYRIDLLWHEARRRAAKDGLALMATPVVLDRFLNRLRMLSNVVKTSVTELMYFVAPCGF
jgi:hypothetical protein